MIYFAQPVEGGPIKIGCSANVQARRKRLESHYGRKLAILATMDGDEDEEQKIHERFSHIRLPGSGKRGRDPEQFRPTAELMAFIGRPLLVGANPDAVEAMEPVRSLRYSVVASPEYRLWMDEFRKFLGGEEVSDVFRDGVRCLAEQKGFRRPPAL